jgi:hypothetical protein
MTLSMAIASRMTRLLIRCGISSWSGDVIANHGALVAGILGDFNLSYNLGQVGMKLSERPECLSGRPVAMVTIAGCTVHLRGLGMRPVNTVYRATDWQ